MQKLRGILVAILIGAGVFAFVTLWLHAVLEAAIVISAAVAVAIVLVVGTRTESGDVAADAAWREAAADLPPVSERRALEALQQSMAGPDGLPKTGGAEVQDTGSGI